MNELNIFSFEGRMSREDFIWHEVGSVIIYFTIGFVWGVAAAYPPDDVFGFTLKVCCIFAFLLLALAVAAATVRRFHDIELPGRYWFQTLIPIWNLVLAYYLNFRKGTEGPNQYGPEPEDGAALNFRKIARYAITTAVVLYVVLFRLLPAVSTNPNPFIVNPTIPTTVQPATDLEAFIFEKNLRPSPVASFMETTADMYVADGKVLTGEPKIAWSGRGAMNTSSTAAFPYDPSNRYYNPDNHRFYLARYVFDSNGNLIDEASVLSEQELQNIEVVSTSIGEPSGLYTEESYTDDGLLIQTIYTANNILHKRIKFNRDNAILQEQYFDFGGRLDYQTSLDNFGNVVASVSFDEEGQQSSKTLFNFDENGNQVLRQHLDANDVVTFTNRSTYDSQNNLIESISSGEDGKITSINRRIFDDQNRLTQDAYYTALDIPTSKVMIEYAPDGAKTETYRSFDDTGQIKGETVDSFASDGTFISSIDTITQLQAQTEEIPSSFIQVEYTDKGLIKKTEVVGSDGQIRSRRNISYNKFDDIVENIIEGNVSGNQVLTFPDSHQRCQYDYDQYNNWIKRVCLDLEVIDGSLKAVYHLNTNEVTYREIKYH